MAADGTVPAWRQYQVDVGDLLSSLGFAAKLEEDVDGARASHRVDVVARRSAAGINQLWVVECKLWNDPVPKREVLTLASIVVDVGADRGLLFSESGFQAGAIRAARHTNLSLTSLDDFRENAADELAHLRLRTLDDRAANLIHRMEAAWHAGGELQDEVRRRYVGPPDILGLPGVTGTTAVLSMLRTSLERAGYEDWPVPFSPLDHRHDDGVMTVSAWEGLLFVAEETLATCECICSYMLDGGNPPTTWTEFQSADMTQLLESIRAG